MKVSYVDAILGSEVKVPTVDGEVTLKVAPGTQPETVMKLADKCAAPRSAATHWVQRREVGVGVVGSGTRGWGWGSDTGG